jgi:uncharacterized caspase-like protein
MVDPVRELKTYARDLAAIPLARVPTTLKKVVFLCVNSYTSYRLNLGKGPINDGLSFAKLLKNYQYEIYYLHNPRVRNFLQYLDVFFQNADKLVIYYVGHGTTVRDLDDDESDKQDEAFVFDDGVVPDDDLITHLIDNKKPGSQIVLVTDACHSGSIWDIQAGNVKGRKLPDGIISVSASNDAQTAKQTVINRLDQGVFTYHLTQILKQDSSLSPNDLAPKMRTALKSYAQSFTVGTTTSSLLNKPLFD